LTAAGRTDTGVHARQMFAHFDGVIYENNIAFQFIFRLNQFLPKDIAIHNIVKFKAQKLMPVLMQLEQNL